LVGSGDILAVEGVVKSFPGVKALSGVSLAFAAGEIHAVVGENGAGKSTLMRILAGVYQADSGRLLLDGRPVRFASAAEAFASGVAMVYQDTRLVGALDAAWNVFLGHEPGGRILVDRAAMIERARALITRLGAAFDPTVPVSTLSRAERQLVEIGRALSHSARILILDEPTSALTSSETETLFALLASLRAERTAVVFISHRMPEVFEIADRISVLKDGELTGTLSRAEATAERVVSMMVGRELRLIYPKAGRPPGDTVLQVEALEVEGLPAPVSFSLRSGEILGFGGIQGSGQQEAARALFGVGLRGGEMILAGGTYDPRGPSDAIAAKLIYVPADRRAEGLLLPLGVRENIALPNLHRWARAGVVSAPRERFDITREIAALAIRTPRLDQSVSVLSGGNQQKVVFARWSLDRPTVYVLDEPTQGIDVATKLDLYRLLRDLADHGSAVVLVSSDLLELIGLSDRILVFSAGAIVDEAPGAEATEERIVGSAVRHSRIREEAKATAAHRSGPGWRWAASRYLPSLLLIGVAALIMSVTSFATPYFLTIRNLSTVAGQSASLAAAALGQTAVLLMGGIDLSVGPVVSLTTAAASWLIVANGPTPTWVGVGVCLFIGAAVGLVNAALIEWLGVPDLLSTLATYSIVQGAALIVRPSPGGEVGEGFVDLMTSRFGALPLIFAFVLVLYAAAEFLLVRGRLGGRIYAIGGSREAATAVGLPIRRTRAAAYVFCGLCASVAGLIVASRIGSGDPQAGSTFTLASITAVVVGGTSVFGGSGTAIGSLLGVLLIVLMQNALNQLQVTAYWQYVWTGALTLAAVTLYTARSRESENMRSFRFRLRGRRGGRS
jgi:ABC-type sugar transport system ATPase subunit/ribose/xylose/arabinose/galactoside ABC-type transport system permease subunit